MEPADAIVKLGDPILVTGAAGFIGNCVVERLLVRGFRNVRCLVRPSSRTEKLEALGQRFRETARLEIITGNLLSPRDCEAATQDVALIYHLAAGTGTKSFPDAFMNSVVTTRNLLEATLRHQCLKRFVNLGSFAVYTNRNKPQGRVLDESCPVDEHPELRGEAYCYAKAKQDELIADYGKKRGIRYVILRPGVVYGPGKSAMIGRVGIGTFGIFLHLGGFNTIPLTYVENCAEAIVLSGLRPGIDGEIINVVDDELPTSREILRRYKANVKSFRSIYVPGWICYLLFYAWEKYCSWSQEQLPPVFNRRAWHAYWKGARYSNEKVKRVLGWSQGVSTAEGLKRYFEAARAANRHA
jgi:nucleoside-diphosphate-sugar epimerase